MSRRIWSVEHILSLYRRGLFPMADAADDPRVFIVDPDQRGILPLEDFHLPRRLARTIRQDRFVVTLDQAFARVVDACAAPAANREVTWINAPIRDMCDALHAAGWAHSVEAWADGELAGGLYGVRLGGAFFGETMFSRATDASKVALAHLVARLKRSGFYLLDAQFITAHLKQFGAVEISRADYHVRLEEALRRPTSWPGGPVSLSGHEVMQSIAQTS